MPLSLPLTLWHRLQTCCQRFLSSFLRIGFTRKSTAPFDKHLKTVPIESFEDIIITGISLQILWLVILLSRPMPDRRGITTSVNTRSMWFCRSSRHCHACSPFSAGITS
ncbi:Os03g0284150 [Oryza sativa Japonica Group]|uniref:Os03g0284150 protein n=1 Tax=Oryza sativa subsp. japonica TaxID=39947 RepID=A0A0P0VW87_ORYSJ|nr:Os03g0284150 [Oryza sativa Japonica Group]